MKLFSVVLFWLLATSLIAAEIKIATLNAYHFFDPAIDHKGKVDDENRLTPDQYQRKTENLASLVKGYEFIALQETGGRPEIEKLAAKAGYEWAFAKGKDTYTGQEVGAVYQLPGWAVTIDGRVGALDKALSKHLLVTARRDKTTVRFLVVHLIRPIGANAEKHQRQLIAVRDWVAAELKNKPGVTVVVLGDFNNSTLVKGGSVLGIGSEAGELVGYEATHLSKKPFDRMVVAGVGKWTTAEVVKPPYGPKPNDLNRSLWSDHFLLGGTLTIE